MNKIFSFEPIVGPKPKVLILGSMPSVKSIEINEYYGFGRNQFWKIMSDLFEFNSDSSYEKRNDALMKNKIALWDVIHSCTREGSLDSNIKDIEVNNIVQLVKDNPSIKTIILNGGKARDIYKKFFKDDLKDIEAITLYSTSPANAIKYEKKLDQWSIVKKIVEG